MFLGLYTIQIDPERIAAIQALKETKTKKARAREVVFWPGISDDTATLLDGCTVCERHSAANHHEPLIPLKMPD